MMRDRARAFAADIVFPGLNKVAGLAWRAAPRRQWLCPCCDKVTALAPTLTLGQPRRHSRCPHCGAGERHRLALHAFHERVEPHFTDREPRILHVAPEPTAASWLQALSPNYETADLFMPNVMHQVDITQLPFDDASYDLVWASHVLAVVRDDLRALSEIRRILRPGGLAVLPIPILGPTTVDYPEAVPGECDNWHGPGWDYEDRFRQFFDAVEWYRSEDAPPSSQTFLYEDRSSWPTSTYPYRMPTEGTRHADGIPLCWVT